MPLPELAVTDADRLEATMAVPRLPDERLVVLQSGSTDPRRCWPAQRFAQLGVPSIGIFWLTNLIEGMPLQTRCPVCGQDNIGTRCPHDESFVADVGFEQVEPLALSLLQPR